MSTRDDNRWTPSWGALSIAALALAAAGIARCSSPAPTGAVAARTEPAATARSAEPERPAAEALEASSAPSAEAPAAAPERKAYVVAALGDSLTDARSSGGKYLDYVKQRCPESRFDNFGKGGDMVNQMRTRFFRDLLPVAHAARYTHLVVFGGVNDLYSDLTAGRTPAKVGKDLTAIFEASRQRGITVVALTVAPWGGFTKYYNESRGRATRELNGWLTSQHSAGAIDHVVDAYALLSCGEAERLCPEYAAPYKDGLHFGPAGHEKLGAALYEQVFKNCR